MKDLNCPVANEKRGVGSQPTDLFSTFGSRPTIICPNTQSEHAFLWLSGIPTQKFVFIFANRACRCSKRHQTGSVNQYRYAHGSDHSDSRRSRQTGRVALRHVRQTFRGPGTCTLEHCCNKVWQHDRGKMCYDDIEILIFVARYVPFTLASQAVHPIANESSNVS
jgi:hypothetical protein